MSLVIDLIGQLNCYVNLLLAVRLVKVDCSDQCIVSQIVSSVYCLSVLVSLISRL